MALLCSAVAVSVGEHGLGAVIGPGATHCHGNNYDDHDEQGATAESNDGRECGL